MAGPARGRRRAACRPWRRERRRVPACSWQPQAACMPSLPQSLVHTCCTTGSSRPSWASRLARSAGGIGDDRSRQPRRDGLFSSQAGSTTSAIPSLPSYTGALQLSPSRRAKRRARREGAVLSAADFRQQRGILRDCWVSAVSPQQPSAPEPARLGSCAAPQPPGVPEDNPELAATPISALVVLPTLPAHLPPPPPPLSLPQAMDIVLQLGVWLCALLLTIFVLLFGENAAFANTPLPRLHWLITRGVCQAVGCGGARRVLPAATASALPEAQLASPAGVAAHCRVPRAAPTPTPPPRPAAPACGGRAGGAAPRRSSAPSSCAASAATPRCSCCSWPCWWPATSSSSSASSPGCPWARCRPCTSERAGRGGAGAAQPASVVPCCCQLPWGRVRTLPALAAA